VAANITTFVAIISKVFADPVNDDPLIATFNVGDDGIVRSQLVRESGRVGDRWQRAFQAVFTTNVDPAFTAYIQTGKIPTGNAEIVRLFEQTRAELDAIRAGFLEPMEPIVPDGDSFDLPGRVYGGLQTSPIGPEDFFVPRFVRSIPGGAAGFAQQTLAGQRQMFGAPARRPVKRSGPRRLKASPARARPVKRGKPKPGTKAWMTYIRGLRKR